MTVVAFDEAGFINAIDIEAIRNMATSFSFPSTRYHHGGLIPKSLYEGMVFKGMVHDSYMLEAKRLTYKKQVLQYLPDAYRKTEKVGKTIVHRVYSGKEDPILIGEGKTKPRAWHSAAGCKLIKVMKRMEESLKPPRDKMAEFREMYGGGTVTGRFASGGPAFQTTPVTPLHPDVQRALEESLLKIQMSAGYEGLMARITS